VLPVTLTIEIQTDEVPEFWLEVRIPREFEGSPAVGLDVVATPEGLNMTLRHSSVAGHRADASLSPAGRSLCHLGQHAVAELGGKPHRPTAGPRVLQSRHLKLHEPTPPLAHSLFRNLERVCDPLIRLASRGEGYDPTTSPRRSRRGARPHRTAELGGLLWSQGNRRRNPRHSWRIASGTDNVNHLAVRIIVTSPLVNVISHVLKAGGLIKRMGRTETLLKLE
jgi:hypothetical protein